MNAAPWQKKFIHDFSDGNIVVAPSGSCVGFVRNFYNELFDNSSLHNEYKQLRKNVYEFTEFLVDVMHITDLGATLNEAATYHDACGALRECHIKEAPRLLLSKVKGLKLQEMNESETCCGFGGTFAVKFADISAAMADQKVDNAVATGADVMISTDLSCLMHLDAYIKKQNVPIRTMHIADVLASGW